MSLNLSNENLAQDCLIEARIRFKTANNVLKKKFYAFSFRLSQESVELALKAAMRLIGLDFPKWHDIGKLLIKETNQFPKEFQLVIPKLAKISEFLAKKREPAMYGDEVDKKSPSNLFDKPAAKEALTDAKFCYEQIELLFKNFAKKE